MSFRNLLCNNCIEVVDFPYNDLAECMRVVEIHKMNINFTEMVCLKAFVLTVVISIII